jgi:hypothetical protein
VGYELAIACQPFGKMFALVLDILDSIIIISSVALDQFLTIFARVDQHITDYQSPSFALLPPCPWHSCAI